jgi:hypothetical protein
VTAAKANIFEHLSARRNENQNSYYSSAKSHDISSMIKEYSGAGHLEAAKMTWVLIYKGARLPK